MRAALRFSESRYLARYLARGFGEESSDHCARTLSLSLSLSLAAAKRRKEGARYTTRGWRCTNESDGKRPFAVLGGG
jgi:hypothetical protein